MLSPSRFTIFIQNDIALRRRVAESPLSKPRAIYLMAKSSTDRTLSLNLSIDPCTDYNDRLFCLCRNYIGEEWNWEESNGDTNGSGSYERKKKTPSFDFDLAQKDIVA